MVPKSIVLKEVIVNEHPEITAENLGIIPYGQKKYTSAERKLYTATSGNGIDGLLNTISGRKAMLKKDPNTSGSLGMAIAEARQGLPGKVWLGLLTEAGTIIADPVLAFAGRLDVPEITDDVETCRITISYESRLIDLNTARSWRYTHESQQVLYPGDLGFEYVTAIQDREITWGRG